MRILVAGFPHSGTTILRKVVGNHPDVFDYHENETLRYPRGRGLAVLNRLLPYEYSGKKHVVYKIPRHNVERGTNADRIIYIIKNPLDVFSSLQLRSGSILPDSCTPVAWQAYARYFLEKPIGRKHYKVRYEDLFGNDFAGLRMIFAWLGLDWDGSVLNTESRFAPTRYKGEEPKAEPPRSQHAAFRAWQTAQKFQNMAGRNRHYLDEQMRQLLEKLAEARSLGYADARETPPESYWAGLAHSQQFTTTLARHSI
jgi:hypothetical protein